MSFEGIVSYLDRFTILKPPERFMREVVTSSVSAVCGIALQKHEITARDGVVYITTNPIIKNEIIQKRAQVVKKINEKARSQVVKEIR